MGCFLGCFGSSKSHKRSKKQRQHKVLPREQQRNVGFASVESVPENKENAISPVLKIQDKDERQLGLLNLSGRKKVVTFDSNVKTYEHVYVDESIEHLPAKEGGVKREETGEHVVKPSQSRSSTEDSSITSSSGCYPPNHRYQNCRDSDDDLDCEESDIDNDDEDEDDDGEIDYDDDIYEDDGKVDSRLRLSVDKVVTEEIDDSVVTSSLIERDVKLNQSARNRSGYVHPVLNPVENITQWNAVKGKGKLPLKQQKENLRLDEEPRMSFSSEPCSKELSFSFKSNSDQTKKSKQEVAVDASLSNWLGSKECTPDNKSSTTGLDVIRPEKGMAMGSHSPSSFEDRPILGALTLEELKQFSASCSPKRSPSRSPDEMPIIGTVGTYWNDNGSNKNSGSAASVKGIPNTTSKYREDKRVNWHTTPFETRLERALNGDVNGAYQTHTSIVS